MIIIIMKHLNTSQMHRADVHKGANILIHTLTLERAHSVWNVKNNKK